MAQPLPRRVRTPHPPVLNKALYGLLLERFGKVEIASPGQAATPGPVSINPRTHRPQASFGTMGEYYRINCPYCNDHRQRLYVNHLWCTPSPVDGEPLWHLATCYNEGCLADHYANFRERVWGWMNASAREAMKQMRVAPGIVYDQPLSTAPMPGECFRVDELERTHPAVEYLEERGFDVQELGETWGVTYCKRAEGMYSNAGRRIVVPIQFQGIRAGWQARFVGELDWRSAGIPKYYTMANFKVSQALYNHDLAQLHETVVVCEGVADVWAVGESGVALFGKRISQRQEELLATWPAKGGLVILLLDPDAWGDPVKHSAFLEGFTRKMSGRVVEVTLPNGRDPGQYDRRALWKLIRRACRVAGFPL